jgi:hypothetical protein
MEQSDAHLGFKNVTVENVLGVDPVVAMMYALNHATDEARPQEPSDWITVVVRVELSHSVPHEVRRVFTFAKGAMCYAHWYYPMLTLGAHELLRVTDFAAAEACRLHGIKAKTFKDRIAELAAAGVISAADESMWTTIRNARNRATHPAAQDVYGFSHAYQILKIVHAVINRLVWPSNP